jgi:hypothetical protein
LAVPSPYNEKVAAYHHAFIDHGSLLVLMADLAVSAWESDGSNIAGHDSGVGTQFLLR